MDLAKMSDEKKKILLVGDNPFHGISHLSQERARVRGDAITHAEYAAKLVMTSLENGADGFMFSVSDTTLSILRIIKERGGSEPLSLYALAPYAYEYVRLATQAGGVPELAKKFAKQIVFSGNVKAIAMGLKGVVRTDPIALMKAYLTFEVSRIKSSVGKQGNLRSVLLHEIITDMALAFNLDWLFKSYVDFLLEYKIRPGFETRNFAYLVNKFKCWGIDFGEITIAAPFNKIGFQMNPSRVECEKALEHVSGAEIVAMSILAAGYLMPSEAIGYIASLPNATHVVVGVSKEKQANETFRLLREGLKGNIPKYVQSS
jgi:hypothetical protein